MNLCIVMPSAKLIGGAEEALLQLVRCREEAHIGMISLIFLEEGPLSQRAQGSGVEVLIIPAGRLRQIRVYICAARAIRKAVEEFKPDAVIAWMTKAHLYGGVAACLARVPCICFQMGIPDGGLVDRLSRFVPAIGWLACSEFAARPQRRVVKRPVLGVALGADATRFSTSQLPGVKEAKRQLGFNENQPLVGIVGRLQRWKGMHVFLDAFARLKRNCPELQGVIVGGRHDLEPEYPGMLERQVERLDLTGMRLAGGQQNVQLWMQAMDVIVHASDSEPFGIVVVEAMALGKPVVASIPGGPEEIIEHGVNGLLVPSNDAEALAGAIDRFLAESEFARSCAAAAKVRAEQFTAEEFAARFGRAVRSIIGEQFRGAGTRGDVGDHDK